MIKYVSLLSALSTLGVLSFGFLLGLKHATEADHVAAVSTIVTEGGGFLRSAYVGAILDLSSASYHADRPGAQRRSQADPR